MPLPPLINCNGNWNDVCAALNEVFQDTFRCNPRPRILGKPLVYDDRVIDGFEEGFWHAISRKDGGDRVPDFRRAERIAWLKPILAGNHPDITQIRDANGKGDHNLIYWAKEHDYVVRLLEKRRVCVFVTAFYITNQWNRDDLAKAERRGSPF